MILFRSFFDHVGGQVVDHVGGKLALHRVEQALESANHGDLRLLHRLCDALAHPFDEPSSADSDLENPPLPDEVVLETYCNT